MDLIVETNLLTKRFPKKLAVDKVSMHIRPGEIYGFIGKNGAGKTTTMKMILGLLKPSEGEIKLWGETNLDVQRKRIGSLIEAPGIYKGSTAIENMRRVAILSGGKEDEIEEILKLVGLGDVGKRNAGAFSLGMKQRLGIAFALLGHPELLVLDEPINGLDPAGIKELRDLFLRLNKERGITILISSHILDELAKITTRYGIVNDGKLVEEVDSDALMERCKNKLSIVCNDPKKAMKILKDNSLLGEHSAQGNQILLFSHLDESAKINRLLVESGIEVKELAASGNGFEDYFIERIGK